MNVFVTYLVQNLGLLLSLSCKVGLHIRQRTDPGEWNRVILFLSKETIEQRISFHFKFNCKKYRNFVNSENKTDNSK